MTGMTTGEGRGGVARPELILLDVNETLSDMSPLAARFEDVGLPGHLARTWFAGLLRDGFALTVTGDNPSFRELGAESLALLLESTATSRTVADPVDHVLGAFMDLDVHPDVPEGLRRLGDLGIRLVTLSNGATAVAGLLLERAGLRDVVETLMSVEDGSAWKPAAAAYEEALARCGVEATRAMLVAIHPWDVHGARSAGLQAAWISRTGGRYPAYFQAPTITAGSLTELAEGLT